MKYRCKCGNKFSPAMIGCRCPREDCQAPMPISAMPDCFGTDHYGPRCEVCALNRMCATIGMDDAIPLHTRLREILGARFPVPAGNTKEARG